jgi:hypothetical protein
MDCSVVAPGFTKSVCAACISLLHALEHCMQALKLVAPYPSQSGCELKDASLTTVRKLEYPSPHWAKE